MPANDFVDESKPVQIGDDRLMHMLRIQHRLQTETYNIDVSRLAPEARADFVRTNVLALTDELHEALNEVGWKPWATSRHMDVEAFISELADAWHFMMNLLLATGHRPEMLAALFYNSYMLKVMKNEKRQEDGYDGVSTKCPLCKRALDDVAVSCWVRGDQGFCAVQNSDINLIKD